MKFYVIALKILRIHVWLHKLQFPMLSIDRIIQFCLHDGLYLNIHGFLFRNSVERNLIDSGVCVKNRLMHTHTHKFNWICIHHENSCHVKLDTWNVCSIWFIWLLWHARKYISERFQSNCDAVDCRSESDRFVKQFYFASCTNSMVANFSFNKFTGSMGCACVLDGLQKSFQCQTKKKTRFLLQWCVFVL